MDMVYSLVRYHNKVDYVLIDTYSTTNFWYAVVIARLCEVLKVPYIPILHGGNLPARLEASKGICKRLFGKAQVNIAPSYYLYDAFAKAGFSNLKHIPNSIEIAKYPFKKRIHIAPNLLWVRAFAQIYNPLMALEVLKIVRLSYPNARLTMIGPDKDGSLRSCQDLAAQDDLPVFFTGKLSKKEWVHRSQEYDLFINTTNFDNTPVSVIEAMALGLPIVSTNVGGLPYLIKDGIDGLLCPPNDPHQFAGHLLDLLKNHEKAAHLSSRGRLKAAQFDWSVVKELWREVLS